MVSLADLGGGGWDIVGNGGKLGVRPETGFGGNCPFPSGCIRKDDIPEGRWLPLARLCWVGIALEKNGTAFSMRAFEW